MSLQIIKGKVPPLRVGKLGHVPTFMQEKLTPELVSVNDIALLTITVAGVPVSRSATASSGN